ncbi:MAG: DUF1015 domain-containing protein [Phycisphaerae bacterium]
MAAIHPFTAIRYLNPELSTLVAPPYDVLSGADKARLLTANGHNIVAVDLPHIPPKEAGPDVAYGNAAHTLATWLEAQILHRDETPALYPYQQTYQWGTTTYQRRGLFCRVRLEDFGPGGSVHPHEQTFSGPKEDRLKLIRATRCNLSPVFGLYDDAQNVITEKLFSALGLSDPMAVADLPAIDGQSLIRSEIWAVTDVAVIKEIQLLLAEKHLYIADGHHRYTTSLNYRKELSERRGVPLSHDDPANFAMFVLVAMQDPGLIIMPTHRVIATESLTNFSMAEFIKQAQATCKVTKTDFKAANLAELENALPNYGLHAMGIYDPADDAAYILQPVSADPLQAYAQDPVLASKSAPWRQLDVAILQHLVFERMIQPHFVNTCKTMQWAFPHEAHEVASLCAKGKYRVGFLLQPTPLEAVRDLCNAGELMPQKSTYFYPKLATGMVLSPLY